MKYALGIIVMQLNDFLLCLEQLIDYVQTICQQDVRRERCAFVFTISN